MRSIALTELFAVIVAQVATGGSCSNSQCDPNAGRAAQYLMSVAADGGTFEVFEPLSPDAGLLSDKSGDCADQCQVFASRLGGCGRSVSTGSCRVFTSGGTSPVIQCDTTEYPVCLPEGTVCGRRSRFSSPDPAPAIRAQDGTSRLLAAMARLEADSVIAFRDLARSLAAHRAPRRLVVRARQAATDEVRHARMMARLIGYRPVLRSPRGRAHGSPSLLEVCTDNAAEGCVRETFGALLASWQAKHARRVDIRETMAAIAIDETRHAALAWGIDAWAAHHLSPHERRLVQGAREEAKCRLALELQREWPKSARTDLGLPSREQANALFRGLSAALWGDSSRAEPHPPAG